MNPMKRPIRWVLGALLTSWLVVGTALWLLSGPSSREVLAASVACTVLLAVGLWWLSGRVPLPGRLGPAFLGFHAWLALLFGGVMIGVTYGIEAAVTGTTLRETIQAARFLGAEFIFWLWLYGLLAAASYGSRFRGQILAERDAATRAEARAVEARLEALRGHLNPHFLFNALHGISALVRRDAARAELALERLGDLLRFSLDEAGDTQVTLRDELRFTRTYLELEHLGMGDRLQTRFTIDESLLDTPIPPFAMQVLVENALVHGIGPRPEGGEITITTRALTAGHELTVTDNGLGADAPPSTRAGRGLANLADRLDALYGAAASLEAGPDTDGGYTATLRWPGTT